MIDRLYFLGGTHHTDKATALKVLDNCSLAFEPLNDILLDRSPDLTDEEFGKLRRGVGDILAYIFDLLIEPAITACPEINPYSTPKT